jgi:hypothetical protein
MIGFDKLLLIEEIGIFKETLIKFPNFYSFKTKKIIKHILSKNVFTKQIKNKCSSMRMHIIFEPD